MIPWDTIKKLSDYAIITGQTQKFLGVPKTIEMILLLIILPGSWRSQYIAASTKVIRDAEGLTYKKNMITIMKTWEEMRGWLTGAIKLSQNQRRRDQILFTFRGPLDIEKFLAKVKDLSEKKASVAVLLYPKE